VRALREDAERWRKFAEDGAADIHAEVVGYQEVKRVDPPRPTPAGGWNDSYFEMSRVVYEQQAVRAIRIRWVDVDGSRPTLLHMIDAARAKEQP
jgi:hypothetical protein